MPEIFFSLLIEKIYLRENYKQLNVIIDQRTIFLQELLFENQWVKKNDPEERLGFQFITFYPESPYSQEFAQWGSPFHPSPFTLYYSIQ
jgi:hypothetical protein